MTKAEQIAKFKYETPDAILASFKDDDDIWDYINHTGRWFKEYTPKGKRIWKEPVNISDSPYRSLTHLHLVDENGNEKPFHDDETQAKLDEMGYNVLNKLRDIFGKGEDDASND